MMEQADDWQPTTETTEETTEETTTAQETSSSSPAPPHPPDIQSPFYQIPRFGKNRRRNTMGILRLAGHSDGRIRTILVDCGKTFYDAALQWFIHHQDRLFGGGIDAVILTHSHADAIMGLDDLRQFTGSGSGPRSSANSVQSTVPIYLTTETFHVVKAAFPYLVDVRNATGSGEVAKLEFRLMDAKRPGFLEEPIVIDDELEIIPFHVHHGVYQDGSPFLSLGFRFLDWWVLSLTDMKLPRRSSERRIMGDKTYLMLLSLPLSIHPFSLKRLH